MDKDTNKVDVQPVPPVATTIQKPVGHEGNEGGTIVLQWLCYAFWFWYGISMSWLAGVVINYFVSRDQLSEWATMLAYPLAAVIVLLVIALITDWFYAKHEPARKTGAANVIMLLHAVPFVLIAIGALVAMVFSLITMVLNSGPVDTIDGPLKVLLVALVVAVIFGLLAYRVVVAGRRALARKISWAILAVIALGFIIGAFAGPALQAAQTKQDRLIETALPSLASDIRQYTLEHDKLPAALTDVRHDNSSSSSSVQAVIDKKLVSYKSNTIPAKDGVTFDTVSPARDGEYKKKLTAPTMPAAGQKRFYYQLCTNYGHEKKSKYNYTDNQATYTKNTNVGDIADYRYDSLYAVDNHPAGDVCYNLYTDGKFEYEAVN